MTSIAQQIAALEARRSELYAGAAGRPLSATEIVQLREIARALAAAWELRRIERAQHQPVEHELLIVREFGR